MKRFLILICLAGPLVLPSEMAAAGFPWFHTRPKPVILDPAPATTQSATETRVNYHGTEVYPRSGRLYFEDAYDRRVRKEQPSKFHFADVFSGGWIFGSVPAKRDQPKAK